MEKIEILDKIVRIICDGENVSYNDFKQNHKDKHKTYVLIRQLVFYFARERYGMKFSIIGYYFHKNHATVMYGVKKVKEQMELYKSFREKVNRYIESLKLMEQTTDCKRYNGLIQKIKDILGPYLDKSREVTDDELLNIVSSLKKL